jgi:rhodanese-related sulfurtransferase
MIKFRIYFLSLLFAAFFVSSCEKEKDPVNEALVLAEYLESTDSPLGKDYVNTDMPSIISASDLNSLNLTGGAYIIDIRSAADFNNGHIQNAHNVTLANLLTHIEGVNLTSYSKVAIVCYTGQTSGYATSLLRIMGYDKAVSLKWGMCSWNANFAAPWNNAMANTYSSQFVTTATAKGPAGELPELSTGYSTGQEILEARVQELLTAGYDPAKISAQTVFSNLSNYYIVNYWPLEQYNSPGHIPGAMQYTPKASMKLAADLKTLPTNKTIVLYCYTGQTSSFLAAYLRLLGYDAKSLLFGANGMIYNSLTSNMSPFSASQIMDYSYVTSPAK